MTVRRRLDMPDAVPEAEAPLDMGGHGIRVLTTHIERDGRPWIPIMGEYHFSRDDPSLWETELRKIRSGGVSVVSTYAIWILHELERGDVLWDGRRDLRRFVETAARVGLDVVLRIGPWVHGETRNGGFPDWVQESGVGLRTDDPAYLELVRGWFGAVAAQVDGLFAPGPIVGVQVENELYDQPDHIATLRDIAEEAGMRAPLWTATGWGGARLPERRVLPVYSGYADGFWEESHVGWPSFGPMHFRFTTVRDDVTVGADLRALRAEEAGDASGDPWPFATCELGGGMQVAYHRRPLVEPRDVAALAHAKIGSGSAWQGFYMFHGGTHPGETQESQATGYPNDLPRRDYDFAAPIGAAGGLRPHFHLLRRQHLFLDAYGSALVSSPVAIGDDDRVRWAVRGGYLFFQNHQPDQAPLGDVEGVRFEVGDVAIPSEPFTLWEGSFAAWPIRQPLGTVPRVTATAQPITELAGDDGFRLVLLAATPGAPVELRFGGVDADDVRGAEAEVRGDEIVVRPTLGTVDVGDTSFVILDEQAADAVWRGEVAGRERLVFWAGEGWFDDGGFRAVCGPAAERIRMFPPVEGSSEIPAAPAPHAIPAPRPDAVIAPVRRGGPAHRLSAPTDDDFALLQPHELPIDDAWFDEGERLLLRIAWTGDVLRLEAGDRLIADQFWSGRDLEVDLTPYRERIREVGLALRAFAWNPAPGVHVDPRVRPDRVVLEVREVEARAERTVLVG
ncbi:beta-galactosidase [Microbacterium indicum]|uniref:beta-galactosidase n=1 Tax=Microbacterium indicum TaxID=358100 RepID=UPI000688F810|nr:beta-galactosidase [Microbacterium indicum]